MTPKTIEIEVRDRPIDHVMTNIAAQLDRLVDNAVDQMGNIVRMHGGSDREVADEMLRVLLENEEVKKSALARMRASLR